jgi:serine/threonine protein kinase
MSVNDLAKDYKLGREVVASSHRGQYVRFATRLSDKKHVIVKQRHKQVSFHNSQRQIMAWTSMMEHLANMQRSPYIAGILDLIEDPVMYSVVMQHVYGTDLFEIFSDGRFAESNLQKVMDFVKSGSGRTRNPVERAKPEHMTLSRTLLKMTKKEEDGSGTESTASTQHESSLFWREKMVFLQTIALHLTMAIRIYELDGLVHKDVKLENVMFCAETETFKLIDFDTVAVWTENTITRDVLGTDQYIAPEAYAGRYTTASDMFALGVLIYKAATTNFPFPSWVFDDDRGQNYVGHPKMDEIRWRLMYHSIDFGGIQDSDLRDFCERALAKDPAQRLTTQQALVHPFCTRKF